MKIASALDYEESVKTLVKKLKYGKMPFLAKTAAAFMVAQFCRLEWEEPDLIVPVPRRHWFQGQNHAELLASHLSRQLHIPLKRLVGRYAGDYSQARLPKSDRESLGPSSFYLKSKESLEGKVILLVDDVMTTGTTLRQSAEVFGGSLTSKIYALTLARSMR